jgi:hypothetical protein
VTQADGQPEDEVIEELHHAFTRHEPRGSARWNFADAFTRLEREFGAWVIGSDLGELSDAIVEPVAPAPPGLRARTRSVVRRVLGRSVPAPQPIPLAIQIQTPGRGRITSGFDATLEALRYLALRVVELEDASARQRRPIEAPASLVEPSDLTPWVETIVASFAQRPPKAEILHAECGNGALVIALIAAGHVARGVEPRGNVALDAAARGVPVRIGEVVEHLSGLASGSLGGIVLSGAVERLAVGEQVELLMLATDRLALGGTLVLTTALPGEMARWSPAARDLIVGRPLDPETWVMLLARAGYQDIDTRVEGGSALVQARRPE